jgi:hypothetical protein
MAAEAIGRNLMGNHNNPATHGDQFNNGNNFEAIATETNLDMGGNNFGISDTSWDDGDAGGGDWDN